MAEPESTTTANPETPGYSPPESSIRDYLDSVANDEATELAAPVTAAPVEAKETPKEDHPLPESKDLQKLAKEGKFAEVLEALGVDIDGAQIPSDRFAKFRKMEKASKAKLEARATQIAQKEQEVAGRINAVLKDYEGFAKAREAWDSGDVVAAIEAAFGESLDAISEKALKQKLSADPELAKLKRKLEVKEKAEQEANQRIQQEQAQKAKATQEAQYIESLKSELSSSDNPTISRAASHKDFATYVYKAQLHAWKTEGVELSSDQAASKVLKLIRSDYEAWSNLLNDGTGSRTNTANTSEPGTSAQNTDRAGKSLEQPRKPKGVSQQRATAPLAKSTDDMSEDELLTYYKKEMTRAATEERMAR